ncbi:MAG: WD40/YVTN/BNR-like repeat-containing protein, partial [Candidatus Rokuibacteriota bacterium]
TPATLYAGTIGAGVFRTTGGGDLWMVASGGLPSLNVSGLAIDPATPSTLYAGTGRGTVKTLTGGVTWTAAEAGLDVLSVLALATDPAASPTVYAGTGSGAFKSTNGGGAWTASNAGLTNPFVRALAVDPVTPTTVYAGTGGGVFKSLDGGSSWSLASSGPGSAFVQVVAIDPVTPATLYAGTAIGVFKSIDGGGNWAAMNAGLGTTPSVRTLAVDPAAPATLYVATAGGGVLKSADGADSWTVANNGFGIAAVFALAVDPVTPGIVYAGTFGQGVFKTANGGDSWSPVNTGLGLNSLVRALVIESASPTTVYAGTADGVFKSTNGGLSWNALNTGLGDLDVQAIAADTATPPRLYAGTSGRSVFEIQQSAPDPDVTLLAAVLPSSRSVRTGTPATAFLTIINAGTATARGARIGLAMALPAGLVFQTTDPGTNVVTGSPNTAVDLPPATAQSFVIAVTPVAPFTTTDVQFSLAAGNAAPATNVTGLNTLSMSAADTPVPDVVALAATLANDGIVRIAGATGRGVFAVATVNVGAPGTITASADIGAAILPVAISLCQTNPASGACLGAPAASVTTSIDANATPSFGIFVQGQGVVPFDPGGNRIFVRFTDETGVVRGSTSVAVQTQ